VLFYNYLNDNGEGQLIVIKFKILWDMIEFYIIIKGESRMSTSKKYVMTYEGIRKLEQELENLKTVKRKEITEKIKTALSFGDLSENSEYDSAKNEQAFVEGRIVQLENMLKNATIVDEDEIPPDVVSVGSIVKVKDYDFNEEVEYLIVGSAEADPVNNKISNESPVGKGLVGKKAGDIIEIQVPDGVSKYKILSIRR
jgi:transcription elongation factor GreA